MLFSALAFRQMIDNSEVRRLRMGEDRVSFVSAPGMLVTVAGLLLSLVVSGFVFVRPDPSIYSYALPLILVAQFLQVFFRTYLQRTLVRTHGFVFRSIAFERIRAVRFDCVIRADIYRTTCWTTVILSINNNYPGHVTFRIFPFSEKALQRILEGWCDCEIRRFNNTTPANPNGRHPYA